jgi:cytochrome b involved in lipid metabolism
MKTTIALLVLFILVLAGGYWWNSHRTMSALEQAYTASPATTTATQGEAATTSPQTSTATYTLAEIAAHNDSKSCWATINGGVYDLTSWISQHPGGAARILSLCGKDGSQAFNTQHSNTPQAQAMLATFRIGDLAQ